MNSLPYVGVCLHACVRGEDHSLGISENEQNGIRINRGCRMCARMSESVGDRVCAVLSVRAFVL